MIIYYVCMYAELHFKQYVSYIVADNFIASGNGSTSEKTPNPTYIIDKLYRIRLPRAHIANDDSSTQLTNRWSRIHLINDGGRIRLTTYGDLTNTLY